MKTLQQSIKLILFQVIRKMQFELSALYGNQQIVNQILESIQQIQLYLSGKMDMHDIMFVVGGISDEEIRGIYEYKEEYFVQIKQHIKEYSKKISNKKGLNFAKKLIQSIQ